jgi:hypothetical protein
MTMKTKKDIFTRYKKEYWKATKEGKGEILDHVSDVAQMHRKAVIRRFQTLQEKDPLREDRRGAPVIYTPDVTTALKEIWEAGNRVCGELLYPVIADYVRILQRDGMWSHGEEATAKLLRMSERTVKRRVVKFAQVRRGEKGISATRPSNLKAVVPIFTGPWKDKPPGYGQIDTVVHCGPSLQGAMAYTVNYIDAATYFTVPRAQWSKGQEQTMESLKAIRERMPVPLVGVHPDTGSEFINKFVIDWCVDEGIELSRSRPGHKNDNMYVEERNGHVIRKTVGYIRLDCPEAVHALNELYDVLAPYLLYFVAVRRTTSKTRVGAKYVRTYEKKAKTPYQRILEHPDIGKEDKERLRREHDSLNPLLMRREIEKRLDRVYDVQKRHGKPKK